jgi:hypothetical protein
VIVLTFIWAFGKGYKNKNRKRMAIPSMRRHFNSCPSLEIIS